MNDFDVRDLLHRATDDAPDRADRADAVAQRGRLVRRRRRAVAAAAGVALLGGIAAVVVPMLPGHPEGGQRVTIQPASPTDAPSPSPSPSATVESPSATPTPTPTPSPTATGATASAPAVGPVDSPTPQPTESLAYSVDTRPGSGGDAGYPLTVVAVHVTGYLNGDVIGSPYMFVDPNETMGFVVGKDEGCSNDGSWRSFDRTFTFSYAFREATAYPIHLQFFTGVCSDRGYGVSQNFRTTIDVSAGSTHGNGPAQPYFYNPFYLASVSGGRITINPSLLDDDGNITQMSVDWGDGGAPTVVAVDQTCHDPAPSGKYWPYSALNRSATSPVLAPGNYTVTITETSVGCDGKDPQTATTSHTFTVPSG